MTDVNVSVTVADAHLARIDEVAAALRGSGLHVSQVHHAIGIISGSIPDSRRQSLETVTGVAAVETDTTFFQLPPPDAPVQ
jgi:hypothetical protein